MSEEKDLHRIEIHSEVLKKIKNFEKVEGYLIKVIPSNLNYLGETIKPAPPDYGLIVTLSEAKYQTKNEPDKNETIKKLSDYSKYYEDVKGEILKKLEEDINPIYEETPQIGLDIVSGKVPFYTIQIKTSEADKDIDQEPKKVGQVEGEKKPEFETKAETVSEDIKAIKEAVLNKPEKRLKQFINNPLKSWAELNVKFSVNESKIYMNGKGYTAKQLGFISKVKGRESKRFILFTAILYLLDQREKVLNPNDRPVEYNGKMLHDINQIIKYKVGLNKNPIQFKTGMYKVNFKFMIIEDILILENDYNKGP